MMYKATQIVHAMHYVIVRIELTAHVFFTISRCRKEVHLIGKTIYFSFPFQLSE